MISALGSAAAAASDQSTTGTTDSGTQELGNEQTFLKLLVAQLQNQNPLEPTDGAQFVSQLAQFSELEQVIGIHTDLTNLISQTTSATAGTDSSASAVAAP